MTSLKEAALKQYKKDDLHAVLDLLEAYALHQKDSSLLSVVTTQQARLSALDKRFQLEGHSPEMRVERGQLRAAVEMNISQLPNGPIPGFTWDVHEEKPRQKRSGQVIFFILLCIASATTVIYLNDKINSSKGTNDYALQQDSSDTKTDSIALLHRATSKAGNPGPPPVSNPIIIKNQVGIITLDEGSNPLLRSVTDKIATSLTAHNIQFQILQEKPKSTINKNNIYLSINNKLEGEKEVFNTKIKTYTVSINLDVRYGINNEQCSFEKLQTKVDANEQDLLDKITQQGVQQIANEYKLSLSILKCLK
jgi:hypothetical protein